MLSLKKALPLLLALVILLSVAGCTATKKPVESPVSSDPVLTNVPSDGEDGEGEHPPETVLPDFSDERNEALIAAFTPEDAEVYTDIPGSIILSANQTLPDMIDFYRAALDSIGAEQTSANDSVDGFWTYAGAYDSEKTITIELRDDGGSVNAIITY